MWLCFIVPVLFFLQLTCAYEYAPEFYGKKDSSENGYAHGCSPSIRAKLKPGLSMEIYSYALRPTDDHCWDSAYLDPMFPRTGYLTHKLLGKAEGIIGPLNFLAKNPACIPAVSTLPLAFHFPKPFTITNFTMLLYGYLSPKKTGKYTFKLLADDLLLMNFGADNAFDCCSHDATKDNIGEYVAYSVWPGVNKNVTVYLESGIYYPLRLFFNNRDAIAQLDFAYYFNDSPIRQTDFSGMFFSIPDSVKCPANIGYKFECRSIKSTTTYSTKYITTKSAKNEIAFTSTIYYVATPCAVQPNPPLCGKGFYDPINNKCFTPEPDYITTIDKGNGEFETDLISHITQKDSNGTPTNTITTTIHLTPTYDYTKTVTSDGHTITEVVSHITTTDSDGEGVVYATTRMFYAEAGEAVHTSAWPYSQPSVVTRTVSESDGVVDTVVISYFPSVGEDGVTRTVTSTVRTITADYTTTVTSDGHTITEVVSHITTTDSDGEGVVYATTRMFYAEAGEAVHTSAWPYSQPSVVTRTVSESDGVVDTVVISYFPSVGEDGVTRTVTSTVRTITADYTTTVTSDGHTITEVVSHITTTDSDGEGVVYATTRMFYAEAGEAVHTSAWPYSQPSVVTRTVSESDGVVDTVVISYFPSVGEDGVTRTVTSTVRTITADYTTTVTSDGHTITEVVSHITTTDSDGEGVVYATTRMFYAEAGEAVHTSAWPYSQPSVVTRTVSESDGVVDTVVISYFPSVGEDGVTRTVTSTVRTITADYTTTVTSDGHTITEVVSHITTTDSDGEGVVYATTRMFYAEAGEAVHTSAWPYSQPSVVTRTVSESDGVVDTVVISYFPSVGEDGVTRTVTSTVRTITADYTTTVTSDGHTITEVVSHITTTDSDGEGVVYATTRMFYAEAGEAVHTSAWPYSQPSVVTRTVSESDGVVDTVVISYFPSVGEDGVTRTVTSTVRTITADYTTTVTSDGHTITEVVSHITTTDSDGEGVVYATTRMFYAEAGEAVHTSAWPYSQPSVVTRTVSESDGVVDTVVISYFPSVGEDGVTRTVTSTVRTITADYTTTVTSDGHTITEVVSHITTTDSDGEGVVYATTRMFYAEAGEAVHTSAWPYSQPSVVTRTVSESDGVVDTVVISYFPSVGEDGVTRTVTSTVRTITADYTTTVTSDGHTITEVVSHITTTDSDGEGVVYATTRMFYAEAGEAVHTSAWPYSQPSVVTRTVSESDGVVDTVVISYFPSVGEDGVTRTVTSTVRTITADYTTTVTSDGHTITEVVSHITTTDSDGEGVVYATTRMFYAEAGEAVHTSAWPYSQPSVVTRTVSESDGVVDTVVISYFPSVGEDGVTRTVTSTVRTITADYTTTVTSDGHTITEVVSHITTTDSDGEGVVYATTRMFYAEAGEAVHTSAWPYSQPSVVTRTVSESDGVVDTVVISYFPSVGEDGVTRTVTSTVRTITADYTTTVTSDGHTITEVVSHITTTDSDGEGVVYATTRMFYAEAGEAVHTSAWPYSQPSVVTRTVSESDGVVDTVVISYFPSVGEDGVTRTVTSTVRTITADYTTTVTSDGHTITEVVSHITTTDSDGEGVVYATTRMFYAEAGEAVHTSAWPYSQPSVVTRTVSESDGVVDTVVISYFPSVGEDGVTRTVTSTVRTITADYTTTVTSDGHTITEVVSHITTTDSDGEGVVYATTRMFYAEAGEAVHTSAWPYSQPSVVTRTVSESDGVVDTVVISYFPSVGEDGVTRTVTSTVRTITADYTTTVTSDGHTITEVVSHITTTDSDGEGVVYATTRMFYAEAGEAVHTSAWPYSQPSVVTRTVSESDGVVDTVVISYFPSVGEDGVTRTVTSTVRTITADYTTTVTSDGHTITEVVSHITTTDSDGEGVVYATTRMFYAEAGEAVHTSAWPYSQPSVVTRTVSESDGVVDTVVISYFPSVGEDGVTRTVTSTVRTITADYTTTVTSDGHTITEVVSHITTTDSDGEGVVYATTRMFYAEAGEAVHTSAWPYSQPSVVTRTVSESDGVVDTVVISYFPSVGEDGVTRTVTSTVRTITADYTTTVTSDGHTITEVVSHITTTDSDGEGVVYATTRMFYAEAGEAVHTSAWPYSQPSVVTRTVSESDGVVDTVVISYFPSVGEDGVTRTVTSTVRTITADYTTTVTSDGHTITEVVSHITTTDSDGEGVVYATTRMFYAEAGEAVHTSAWPYSQPSVVTRTVSESDGVVDTVVISYFPSVGEDGVTRTVTSTVRTITADYTTTVTSDGHTITEVVSHITTTDSDGEGVVYATTRMFYAEAGEAVHTSAWPYSQPSVVTRTVSESDGVVDTVVISYFPSVGEDGVTRTVTSTVRTITADYTTTVTSDGHTITEVVSHITTTDSDGEGVVYATTRMFYAEAGEAVHTSAWPYSQPSVVTRTVSESDGVVDTVVISYFPSVGEDGVTRTVTSTVRTITADYTTTVTSDGHTITEVVSHITTTDSDGEGVVYATTRMFYAEAGEAVHTSAWPYSQPSVVTRTVSESDGVVDTVVISYFPSVGEDGVTRTVTSTVRTITADYTTTVTSDGHTITEVVSHITTTDSDGEGVVYATTRMFYAEAGEAVHTSAWPYSQPSVVTRTVSESDGVVDTVVISYFPSVGEDGVTRTVTSTVRTITADYTTTVTSDGHTITEVVSHITTTDSDGEGVVYATTRMFYAEAGEAVHTSAWPYSQPSVVTRTVSESDGVVDTVVISYFPSVGEDGVTRTVTSTVRTITADYTTTVTSDGHTITEVVSHITTTDSDGEGVVYATTRMFYAEAGEAVHTSAWPYSQPSVVTRTVSESDGVVDTVVISYFPSVGEDGVTRTVTSTVRTITADYTTTVTSDGHTITEVVSHITTTDSDGEGVVYATTRMFYAEAGEAVHTSAWPYSQPSVVTRTVSESDGVVDTVVISYFPSVGEDGVTRTVTSTVRTITADYTTTVTSDGHTITEVVSHITTTDSDGEGVVYATTRMFYAEAGEAVHTSAWPYSQPSVVTRTVSESDGVVDTVVISYFPSVGEDGVTRTVTSTVRTITADYTTTVTSDGHTITEVVSHITTTDSDGEGVVYATTRMFYAEAGEAVHTSAWPYSQPSVVTRTVSESDGVVDTVVISYFPSVGEDGVTRTVTSTVRTITADYTTTVTSDGHTITEVVSHITTTDSDGEGVVYATTRMFYAEAGEAVHTSAWPYSQPSVVTRTVSESDGVVDTVVISYFPSVGEDGVTRTVTSTVRTITADYTTTVTSDGHTITEVVSHITTTDSDGEGVVYATTRMFYAEAGEAVHTSAWPYSQPSVVTRTVSESDGVVDTVVISYFPSVGEDGVTRTVTSTVRTITADYTTTVTSDGHTITEVVSHITTTDSDGEGVVYATTRMFYAEAGEAVHTSAWPYSQPSVVTRTVSESDGVVDTVVISYFPSVGEDGVTRTVTSTVRTITADYTTTVTSDGHTITEVVSHITTTDSDGEGVVYATTRMFYAEAGEAVHTSAWPYSQPSVVTRTVSESDGVVDTVVISYFPSVGEDGVTRTVTSTVRTITADYTTTVTSDGHTITEVVSHITTTDSDGEGVVYATTRMFYAEAGEAVHTSAWPYSQPSVVTRTVSESDGVVDTVVISYFPSVGEDGVTRTVTSTVRTITADYTTTVTSDGHTITEVVSHITTTDSDGEGVVYATTRMFYAEAGEAVHTSAWPYSQPSVVTRTVSESDGVVDTVVISYFPSVGEDGVTRTVTSTVRTITADYTTTVTSDGHTITEVVSHITTTDSDGEGVVYATTRMFYAEAGEAVHTSAWPYSQPSVVTRTVSESDGVVDTVVISYFPSVGEDGVTRTVTSTVRTITADYTTTVTSDGHTITEVVSHITTTDSDGEGVVYATTRMFYAEAGEAVHTSAWPYSQPSVVTRTVSESDGVVDTVVISYFPSVGEDGVTRTVTSTVRTITADYTTTVTSDGHTITEVVSHITTTDSDGQCVVSPKTIILTPKLAPIVRTRYFNSSIRTSTSSTRYSSTMNSDNKPTKITTTVPVKSNDLGEADFTKIITTDGHIVTEVILHITATNSLGRVVTYVTTAASYDQVDEGVFRSPSLSSQPPVSKSTFAEDDGSSKSTVISYLPSNISESGENLCVSSSTKLYANKSLSDFSVSVSLRVSKTISSGTKSRIPSKGTGDSISTAVLPSNIALTPSLSVNIAVSDGGTTHFSFHVGTMLIVTCMLLAIAAG
ncbi:EPA13 [Nakaseomyces glabratus]|uniref:EPA13 n=1 Tax=Candida glabrata TaxID=5478 RepID=UPI00138B46F1|nr:EPA13 [Nakaseomyces glabratus]